MRVPDAPPQPTALDIDPVYMSMARAMVWQERQSKVEPMPIGKVLSSEPPKIEAD